MTGDLRHRDGLVLEVDRAARGIDRALVLLQDRSLDARGDIAAGIEHALDLHRARPARLAGTVGIGELVAAVARPVAVRRVTLAGLVPALDEIVAHVRRRRPGHLDIDVVQPHRDAGEVEAAHEGGLRRLAGIDHPALLMLAEHRRRPVPADLEARPTLGEQRALLGRAAEHARTGRGLGIGTPDQQPHVDAARDGPIEHVEQRLLSVRDEKVVGVEGHGQPDAVARIGDRLADAPHDLRPVDERRARDCRGAPDKGPTSCRECRRRRPPSRSAIGRRHDQGLVGLQLVDLRVAHARLAQHLLAVAADARRVAAELDLGLLEVERAGKGRDRPFGRMLALGEEAGRLEMRIVQTAPRGCARAWPGCRPCRTPPATPRSGDAPAARPAPGRAR